jgi:hypothetical protein
VIILDENIFSSQRLLLSGRRFKLVQIGVDIGRKGMKDEEIIPLLHKMSRSTFLTRDEDFFNLALRHERYCLIWLDVSPLEVAHFALRVLRHPELKSRAKRMGSVIRASATGMRVWRGHERKALTLPWK